MSFVSVQNLHKKYGNTPVIRGVSFEIAAGEVLVLLGKSGSGKSTLLRCLNGLEQAQYDCIRVAGHDMSYEPHALRQLRMDVGIVFQQYNLFPHLTVGENIMLAPKLVKKSSAIQARESAQKVLAQVGLAEKFDVYPDSLSGGQQQRVAIARSLAMQPQLMLFDEVTSALDPQLTAEVLIVMEALAAQGMGMVVVTHELNFARKVADRIIFMHEGRICEQGPPEQLFSAPASKEFQAFLAAAN